MQLATVGEWRGRHKDIVSARYRMTPLAGWMALAMPQRLIADAVDLYYGGSGTPGARRKALSAAEMRVFARMAGEIGEMLAAIWADIATFTPQPIERETGALRPALEKDLVEIAIQPFTLTLGGTEHAIEALYPLALLRALPPQAADADEIAAHSPDAAWQAALSGAVMEVRLPLRTIFARPELSLSRLLALKPGDILPVHLPAHVPVTVGGRHFAQASVGDANGRTAIKIETMEGYGQ